VRERFKASRLLIRLLELGKEISFLVDESCEMQLCRREVEMALRGNVEIAVKKLVIVKKNHSFVAF
jgi:hypothetical protein